MKGNRVVYDFEDSMNWEQRQLQSDWFKQAILARFPNSFVRLTKKGSHAQKSGTDVKVFLPEDPGRHPSDKSVRAVEVKLRRKHYDDMLVELKHRRPDGSTWPGWAVTGLSCDELMYVDLEHKVARFIDWEQWWHWWLVNVARLKNLYPARKTETNGWETGFTAIPWTEFENDVRVIPYDLDIQ